MQLLLELEPKLQQELGLRDVKADLGEALDMEFSPLFLLAPFHADHADIAESACP